MRRGQLGWEATVINVFSDGATIYTGLSDPSVDCPKQLTDKAHVIKRLAIIRTFPLLTAIVDIYSLVLVAPSGKCPFMAYLSAILEGRLEL